MTATLRCRTCRQQLPDTAFHQNKSRPERRGRHDECSECRKAWYWTPGVCRMCGEPTRSQGARLCDPCRAEHQTGVSSDRYFDTFDHNGYWTRELVIEAIQAWERRHGQPPAAERWRGRGGHTLGKRTKGTWPTTRIVQHLFGTWNAAVEAAGFKPHPPWRTPSDTCQSGRHPWTPANTYISPRGIRRCRACDKEYRQKYAKSGKRRGPGS